MSIAPYKIRIPDAELELLRRKVELVRLDPRLAHAEWTEKNGVTYDFMKNTLDFWRDHYDWRKEEAEINMIPQFTTPIEVDGFGSLEMHFAHSRSSTTDAIPLLFVHGWPGSFVEVKKIMTALNDAGFHVVAPSLPGYGFSSYTDRAGFAHNQHAEALHKIMLRLGYDEYVVQGGDWGSLIVRVIACNYPTHAKAMHINMLPMAKPSSISNDHQYTEFEQNSLGRLKWYIDSESDYSRIQGSKSHTLGYGLHDSPVAMLAWMADKLFLWTDKYPWTPTEIITWTLMHYLPGPTTALATYREITHEHWYSHFRENKVTVPCGLSAFHKELLMVPRCWAETTMNVQFWKEHPEGGHFAAYEKPEALTDDLITFFKNVWRGKGRW